MDPHLPSSQSQDSVIRTVILEFFPQVQAIYRFGSGGTPAERQDSDVDLAVLLPPRDPARETPAWETCLTTLERSLGKPVDLIDLRRVPTVFQLEIVGQDRLLAELDPVARQSFEMLVLSFYQKLQEERKEILQDIKKTKRIML